MVARYLVPALAVAGHALAQSSCSTSATLTIQNQGDATGIASCSTFEGDIEIAGTATGSIALDGISEITGSLVSNNASQLTALSAGSLEMIGRDFILGGAIMLSQLTMPELTDVGGKLSFSSLNALQGLQFTSQIKTAGELSIDDTQLYSLTGINLERVDSVSITANGFLNDITMQLANVTGSIFINNNGNDMCNVTFPNLIWANELNIMNVQSFLVPSLESTNKSLFLAESSITSFSAPNLTTIGSDFSIVSNSELTNISVPLLTTISGALKIVDNQKVEKVDGFPALEQIIGAVNITGSMSEIDFPALKDVKGAFYAVSSGDITDSCSHFNKISGTNNVIKVKPTCTPNSGKKGSGSTNGGSGTTSGGSDTSSGAANPLVITGATGLLGVVAAIFGML